MGGVRGNHWARWSREEDAILEAHYPALGAAAVAALLPGRTVHAVQERAEMFRLRPGQLGPRPGQPVGDFGILVRGYREQTGWSQMELSRRLGMKPTLVGYWERGALRPSLQSLAALVCVLDLHGQDVEALLLAAAAMGNERREVKSA